MLGSREGRVADSGRAGKRSVFGLGFGFARAGEEPDVDVVAGVGSEVGEGDADRKDGFEGVDAETVQSGGGDEDRGGDLGLGMLGGDEVDEEEDAVGFEGGDGCGGGVGGSEGGGGGIEGGGGGARKRGWAATTVCGALGRGILFALVEGLALVMKDGRARAENTLRTIVGFDDDAKGGTGVLEGGGGADKKLGEGMTFARLGGGDGAVSEAGSVRARCRTVVSVRKLGRSAISCGTTVDESLSVTLASEPSTVTADGSSLTPVAAAVIQSGNGATAFDACSVATGATTTGTGTGSGDKPRNGERWGGAGAEALGPLGPSLRKFGFAAIGSDFFVTAGVTLFVSETGRERTATETATFASGARFGCGVNVGLGAGVGGANRSGGLLKTEPTLGGRGGAFVDGSGSRKLGRPVTVSVDVAAA